MDMQTETNNVEPVLATHEEIDNFIRNSGSSSWKTYNSSINSMIKHINKDLHYIFANPTEACIELKQNGIQEESCKVMFKNAKSVLKFIRENEFRAKFGMIDEEHMSNYTKMIKSVYAETNVENNPEIDDGDDDDSSVDTNIEADGDEEVPNYEDQLEHEQRIVLSDNKPNSSHSLNAIKHNIKQLNICMNTHKDTLLECIETKYNEHAKLLSGHADETQMMKNEINELKMAMMKQQVVEKQHEAPVISKLLSDHADATQKQVNDIFKTLSEQIKMLTEQNKALIDKYNALKNMIVPIVNASSDELKLTMFEILLNEKMSSM
jgi:hypothetical protein